MTINENGELSFFHVCCQLGWAGLDGWDSYGFFAFFLVINNGGGGGRVQEDVVRRDFVVDLI